MKNKLILVVIILIIVGLHLLPLIPPDVEMPKSDDVKNASIEQANELYKNAMYGDAIKYYYELAQQGDAVAQYKTGMQYLQGRGIKMDRCEATYWFDKSARAGNQFAQFQLARSYYYGYGLEKDSVLAYIWARTAIENIDTNSNEIDRIKSFYSDVQNELENNNRLDSAVKKFQSWQYKTQKPVEITRLRKIPVFDQFLSEAFDTLPCN
jgi:hypothetical protein